MNSTKIKKKSKVHKMQDNPTIHRISTALQQNLPAGPSYSQLLQDYPHYGAPQTTPRLESSNSPNKPDNS